MALSIKDEATDRVVRRYAALRRTSYTQAIKLAVTEALEREGGAVADADQDRRAAAFMKVVREAQEAFAKAPILDDRPYDEILYDKDGLPH